MSRILIINGPNLNLLGKREKEIYGEDDFETFFEKLKSKTIHNVEYFQSNVEGEIINTLQKAEGVFDGVILNPGGYTHTSVAISDCIAAIDLPVVEVHISNLHRREDFRLRSLTGMQCEGIISGFGLKGYSMALNFFE